MIKSKIKEGATTEFRDSEALTAPENLSAAFEERDKRAVSVIECYGMSGPVLCSFMA